MTDNANDERIDGYLRDLDAAADWQPEGAGWDGYQPWTLDGNGSIVRAAPAPTCPHCGRAVTVLSTGEAGCWRCLTYWPNRAALDAATCERVEE